MEEITLVRDFAIIMIVAGAVTLLFRRLHQPPILGYLISGLLIGPYTLPVPPVTDVHTVKLLADLGLVLLLFGLGLEFSWSKIREVGSSVLIIGVIEIFTMIGLGYGLGRLLNWTPMDSFFLGAALHISSSALIVKILRDMGKLNLLSSRLIVGILVVEDFAAVALIALLSGIATTGAVDFAGIGSLILRLLIFTVASLAFGTLIVPRIINFTRQFRSKEALLITSLGLCFALALLSRYLGLSVAAGAFLMGALIGDTNDSEEIIEIVTPVRDV
ncbi:MAG: cation:proton antiporter, partial [Chloroflexota bacterium]|nr:cation:proton antiporter [Chloroflexota bacterium]